MHEVKRASVKALDDILGNPFPILDNGFIRVIDYMGDDSSIVQAARVSYGKGTKSSREDNGLIRYLMRNGHTSPFEMCLGGDVRVPTFPCDGAQVKHYTIAELAQAFEDGGRENSWVKLVKIRTVNPVTKMVTATKIKRAWRTGTKMVYEIVTAAPFNRRIRVTDNHPIMTPHGFARIDQGLSVGDEIMHNGLKATPDDVIAEIQRRRNAGQTISNVASALGVSQSLVFKYAHGQTKRKTSFLKKQAGYHVDPRAITRRSYTLGQCEVSGCSARATDRHHIDENPHNNNAENFIGLCAKHHKHMHTMGRLHVAVPAKIVSITPVGVQPVYDLEVEDDNHTFVAEGIVVHNCEIKLHVKLPIFVARQWIRHRTANVNEYSARYSIMNEDFYVPTELLNQSEDNKQGSNAFSSAREDFLSEYVEECKSGFCLYNEMISENVSREQARMVLPVSAYTELYWKIDLHNLLHFLKLRANTHAQYEIRVYAEAIMNIIRLWVPHTHQAFLDYHIHAKTLSKQGIEVVRKMLAGESIDKHEIGLSDRELNEITGVFQNGF